MVLFVAKNGTRETSWGHGKRTLCYEPGIRRGFEGIGKQTENYQYDHAGRHFRFKMNGLFFSLKIVILYYLVLFITCFLLSDNFSYQVLNKNGYLIVILITGI